MSSSTSATATAAVNLSDLTTAQLSERMNKLAERHDALKSSVSEFETVKSDLSSTLSEIQKRLGTTQVVPTKAKPKAKKAKAKPEGEKKPRAKKTTEGDAPKFPSLKEVVLTVLGKHPDGLELKGIVAEVQGMINRKEYASSAKSLSAVVSQAVNALKQENLINHDRESKKYTKKAA